MMLLLLILCKSFNEINIFSCSLIQFENSTVENKLIKQVECTKNKVFYTHVILTMIFGIKDCNVMVRIILLRGKKKGQQVSQICEVI